jgi:arylsulfatase A-like enzyme
MNILLITLDQFRGDCLSAAGHPIVRTPHLDRLAAEGVRFARHYSQCAPCGPGRASLYSGLYQMNHRVVANGTPLDRRFDNIALAARRAGYAPTLFGYTDQSLDPRDADGPDDPRLSSYEGILPGFEIGVDLSAPKAGVWMEWLRGHGHDVPDSYEHALRGEPERPAEHSASAFLVGELIEWTARRDRPWFAHLSQLRPHPPYGAAGAFSTLYDPADMPAPIEPAAERHPLHERMLGVRGMAAPSTPERMRQVKAQYYGMVSEADHQFGRLRAALEASGQWADTFVIVTADHGEQMGDHGLIQKLGYFEESYHIPAIVRDPKGAGGRVVQAFTENIDVFPTLCEAMGIPVPAQCDGLPLTPFLRGETPPWWRDAAHWEYDWRANQIPNGPHAWPWDRRLEDKSLTAMRTETIGYVQFADGSSLCFDLAADPTWRTRVTDPAVILAMAQAMLAWRAQHADRTMSGLLLQDGGVGRWPPMPEGWGRKGAED